MIRDCIHNFKQCKIELRSRSRLLQLMRTHASRIVITRGPKRKERRRVWRIKHVTSGFSPSLCTTMRIEENAARGKDRRVEKNNIYFLLPYIRREEEHVGRSAACGQKEKNGGKKTENGTRDATQPRNCVYGMKIQTIR